MTHMTDHEIVYMYRHAKFPEQQISILSQLCCCSEAGIERVLVRNGCELPKRKKGKRRGRPPKVRPKPEE